MISGLNQEVEILGKTFHVQTEVSDAAIRTEVFLGGKVVAARETPLSPEEQSAGLEVLRGLMNDQQQSILAGMLRRAERYRARQEGRVSADRGRAATDRVATDRVAPGRVAPGRVAPDRVAAGRPAAAEVPAGPSAEPASGAAPGAAAGGVEMGLKVRRLLERFRLRIARLPRTPEDAGECLEGAAEAFKVILSSPMFGDVRIDDQVRFNLLKDQIYDWFDSGQDPRLGLLVWSEIVAFNDNLADVNNRSELAAFDRDLLTWALRRVEDEGMSIRTLEHLRMVSGRDPRLDRLLAQPMGVEAETWSRELRRVLAEIR